MNSGIVDAMHGDIPELANRIRSWIGTGNEVIVASDQPHRVAELLAAQEIPATAEESHARRPGEEAAEEADDTEDHAAGPAGFPRPNPHTHTPTRPLTGVP